MAIAAVAGILATTMAMPVIAKQDSGPIAFTVIRDGSPVANATVTVRVMPAQATWADYEAGEPIDMPIVAQGLTSGSGRLHLAPAAVVTGRANGEGEVNLLAVISSRGEAVTWWFPLQVVASDLERADRQNAGTASDHRKADLTVDLGTHPGVAEANDPPSKWAGLTEEQLTSSGLLAVAKTQAPGEMAPQ